MKRNEGVTRREVMVLMGVCLAVGAFAAVLMAMVMYDAREEAMRIRCIGNLCRVAKGVFTYVNEHGGDRWYPFPLGLGTRPDDYNGAEWLASLYWTRVLPDPWDFLCPRSPDTNDGGRDLGTRRAVAGRFGSQTVSYAAMHYRSLTDEAGDPRPRAIPHDLPFTMPMASGDTQGTINHGWRWHAGMNVLFFDTHVEWRTHRQIDLLRGVGQTGGLLWQLRN